MPLDPPVTTTRRGGRLSAASRGEGVEVEDDGEEEVEAKTTTKLLLLRLPATARLGIEGARGAGGAMLREIRTGLPAASA